MPGFLFDILSQFACLGREGFSEYTAVQMARHHSDIVRSAPLRRVRGNAYSDSIVRYNFCQEVNSHVTVCCGVL